MKLYDLLTSKESKRFDLTKKLRIVPLWSTSIWDSMGTFYAEDYYINEIPFRLLKLEVICYYENVIEVLLEKE